MSSRLCFVLMLAALVCHCHAKWNKNDRTKVLAKHNELRTNEHGCNMSTMKYSMALEKQAREWAEGCTFAHGHKDGLGQNLYATTGAFDINDAVMSWFNEKVDYSLDSNSCRSGRVCGHYTQVVWADTTEVGCYPVECPNLKNTGWKVPGQYFVCDYNPPGNYVGQKPYDGIC